MHKTVENLLLINNKIKKEIGYLNNVIADPPQVIAVSKTFTLDHIKPLIESGHSHFGENKVQEAINKWGQFKKTNSKIKLHMLGKLQTNKVKQALQIFDFLHSLDSYKLAECIFKYNKKINSKIKISSDFIIGYPGENKKDFDETIDLIKKVGFINSYSFIFSPRPGTPAATKEINDINESKKRLNVLQKILENFQVNYNGNYLEKYCEVLVENRLDNQEKYFGRTKYMTPVIFKSQNCKPGELISVKITSYNRNNLFGYQKIDKKEKAA